MENSQQPSDQHRLPQFYLVEDTRGSEESLGQQILLPKRQSREKISSQPSTPNINNSIPHPRYATEISLNTTAKPNEHIRLDSPVMTLKDKFTNRSDILKFPVESSHSYSYAHLSPNSLALRLNVLKRSLEILRDRPRLINSLNPVGPVNPVNSSATSLDLETSLLKQPLNDASFALTRTTSNLQSNASSAALAALFKPTMKRSETFPVEQILSLPSSPNMPELLLNLLYSDDLSDIIRLLEVNGMDLGEENDFASTLHDLSLSSETQVKQNAIKTKLIYALSTPFVDTTVMTASTDSGVSSPVIRPSSLALNLLNQHHQTQAQNLNSNSRPYHSISSGKHALPQSIFTIDCDPPWSVKAANDLACLMFGVLKNMIKTLTLMDLIAPQFREFVTDRISRSLGGVNKNQTALPNTEIIFAGEIVAISRPGDKHYAWTSLWAKKRGNLIIFMFDQIPCDAFDVVVLKDQASLSNASLDFDVVLGKKVAGDLVSEKDLAGFRKLSQISNTMSEFINQLLVEDLDEFNFESKGLVYSQSERLNIRRYFTLHINNENIPCAVTSNPLERNPDKYEMKLKVHSLPYIAGIFVVDSLSLKIISCNNAIARNLFGWSSLDLNNQSIDMIIPKFSTIFHTGLLDPANVVSVVPGLVLPEHFFRRYNCVVNSPKSVAESFISSRGLLGQHKDGAQFFVDVQLRVSAEDTYVLWVTYSRQFSSKFEVSGRTKRARLKTGEHSASGFARLPSQLRLVDQGTSFPTVTGDIVRHNSTRTPKNVSSKFKPLSRPPSDATQGSEGSGSFASDSTKNTSLGESYQKSVFHHQRHTLFDLHSEPDLLQQENEVIQEKALQCKSWPVEIGSKRRQKKFDEFEVLRVMGTGAYGKVVLARHKKDLPYEIIIKCIDKERILVDTWVRDRNLGTIPSEIQVMSTLMKELHPNIMRIIDFFEDEQHYYLETPIFGNPPAVDLFDYIEVRKDMTEVECQFIFKQICLAIFHLHKHGIVHRDIKDENVIVDERGVIKLIDFGSASYTKLGPFDVFVGTIDYASPEVLRGEKYDGKPQDIWALGILLYTILFKENPFYNVDEIMDGDLRLPNIISEPAIELVKKILVRDIDKRPTISDILEHEWLQ